MRIGPALVIVATLIFAAYTIFGQPAWFHNQTELTKLVVVVMIFVVMILILTVIDSQTTRSPGSHKRGRNVGRR